MVSDITSYLRRNSNMDSAVINKILQDMAEIQPVIKGDSKQERIAKISEVYQVIQTASIAQWTYTLDDETSIALDTETTIDLHLEVGNAP